MGAEELKIWMESMSIIMGVFQEDLPQKHGECKHLSITTLRGKRDYFHRRCQVKGNRDHFPTHSSSSAQVTPMAMPPKHFSLQTLKELVGGDTPVCVRTECKNSCKWNFLLWDQHCKAVCPTACKKCMRLIKPCFQAPGNTAALAAVFQGVHLW